MNDIQAIEQAFVERAAGNGREQRAASSGDDARARDRVRGGHITIVQRRLQYRAQVRLSAAGDCIDAIEEQRSARGIFESSKIPCLFAIDGDVGVLTSFGGAPHPTVQFNEWAVPASTLRMNETRPLAAFRQGIGRDQDWDFGLDGCDEFVFVCRRSDPWLATRADFHGAYLGPSRLVGRGDGKQTNVDCPSL